MWAEDVRLEETKEPHGKLELWVIVIIAINIICFAAVFFCVMEALVEKRYDESYYRVENASKKTNAGNFLRENQR